MRHLHSLPNVDQSSRSLPSFWGFAGGAGAGGAEEDPLSGFGELSGFDSPPDDTGSPNDASVGIEEPA